MAVGRIHSSESFGTVDGPGIRYVLFMQGCPMRCLYCHNPDTWDIHGGREMTVAEVLAEYKHNKAFYKNGGITVTGGEPLLQIDFVTELFRAAKKEGIHTCIDTSGVTYNGYGTEYEKKLDELMSLTDLVMLDIKHIDDEAHRRLTGRSNENILEFARYLAKKKIPLWVRHVVVNGYTDSLSEHTRLGEFLATLPNLKALDVLPYHTLGVTKYREMGMEYPLEGLPAMTLADAAKAKSEILAGMKKAIAERKKQ